MAQDRKDLSIWQEGVAIWRVIGRGELRIDILFDQDNRQRMDAEDQHHLSEQFGSGDAEHHDCGIVFQGAFEQDQLGGLGIIGDGLVAVDGEIKK